MHFYFDQFETEMQKFMCFLLLQKCVYVCFNVDMRIERTKEEKDKQNIY